MGQRAGRPLAVPRRSRKASPAKARAGSLSPPETKNGTYVWSPSALTEAGQVRASKAAGQGLSSCSIKVTLGATTAQVPLDGGKSSDVRIPKQQAPRPVLVGRK